MSLPLLDVLSPDDWAPSSEPIRVGRWVMPQPVNYENFAAVASVAGWVAVPLFLAGVSGLVKKVDQ